MIQSHEKNLIDLQSKLLNLKKGMGDDFIVKIRVKDGKLDLLGAQHNEKKKR